MEFCINDIPIDCILLLIPGTTFFINLVKLNSFNLGSKNNIYTINYFTTIINPIIPGNIIVVDDGVYFIFIPHNQCSAWKTYTKTISLML